MRFEVLLIIVAVLIALCAALFTSVICIKIVQERREKARVLDRKKIDPVLRKLLAADSSSFFNNHIKDLTKMAGKLKGKYSLQTLEDVLLVILEDPSSEVWTRAQAIARHFEFPEKSLSMIRDRLSGNIAIGCRKAGLYRFAGAIPDILKALNILSSEVQLQALTALARIGDADTMVQAFDQIHKLIFVNERAINEMLHIFSGDRLKLYKKMICHKSDYLVRLSLKAIDTETANMLVNSIIAIFRNSDKETRLACIIAIGKSGNTDKIPTIVRALADKEWEVRAMAAKTLGSLTSPEAVMPLAGAARDREWWVRQNAVTSILAYPNHDEILVSIAQTGDKYAYNSMLYTLDKANEIKLLSRIKEIWEAPAAREGMVSNKPGSPRQVAADAPKSITTKKRYPSSGRRKNTKPEIIPVY